MAFGQVYYGMFLPNSVSKKSEDLPDLLSLYSDKER